MKNYRTDFPLLMSSSDAYLDNAATSQRPQCVIDAVNDFYLSHNANPLRGNYPLSVSATEIYENARETVRAFINAESTEEIIFTRNTTESINLIAYSYALSHLKSGDEIVVSITEHHSDLLPWQMASRMTGAKLVFIDCEQDGSIDLDKAAALITEKTKIVACAQVSNVIGRVNPIKELAQLAHAKGAVMVCDGAQSVPHMTVDVRGLGVDFLAFSGHKLFGPMGTGVLYGRRDLLEEMPPFLYGGEMIATVKRDSAVYAELPHKFEAGTVNAAGAAGLAAAIRYIQSIGFEEMHARELEVTAHALEGLKKIPHINIIGSDDPEEHTGIITFTVDGVHPHDVSEILAADGVDIRAGHHCAQPLLNHLGISSSVRASFMFYNTVEEAERLIKSLASVRERMGYGE